jgi:C-terminal processing protease CtpA/Prc
MLHGIKVENTLFGGPAFGQLMKGDILVKIDGVPVSEETILADLRGSDIPGSTVVLTVQRSKQCTDSLQNQERHSPIDVPNLSADEDDMDEIDIRITRIATAEIADRRKMFDHFTSLQVRAGK